jgi:hypothetical protein
LRKIRPNAADPSCWYALAVKGGAAQVVITVSTLFYVEDFFLLDAIDEIRRRAAAFAREWGDAQVSWHENPTEGFCPTCLPFDKRPDYAAYKIGLYAGLHKYRRDHFTGFRRLMWVRLGGTGCLGGTPRPRCAPCTEGKSAEYRPGKETETGRDHDGASGQKKVQIANLQAMRSTAGGLGASVLRD